MIPPSLEQFYLDFKPRLIRLPGCEIYQPDAAARSGYRKLDGGRSVYVQSQDDTTGLAVVSHRVVGVVKVNPVRWNVVRSETETPAPGAAA